MDSSDKFWLVVWSLVVAAIVAIAVIVGYTTYRINVAAFEHGYEAAQKVGSTCTSWQKVKPATTD